LLNLQDIAILQKIKDILQRTDESNPLCYIPDGSVITKSDVIARAVTSNHAIKESRTQSIEEVRAKMKSW